MRTIQRTIVSLVALAVAAVPFGASAPASAAAAVGGPAAAVAPCLTDLHTGAGSARGLPEWRRHSDTVVTAKDLAALPARETRAKVVKREVTPRLPATVVIPVYAHIIRGKHREERKGPKGYQVRNLVTILNNAMGARQSSASSYARYRFTVVKIDRKKNDGWYHAQHLGPRDQKMKRKLHRGNAKSLNLYFNGGGPRNQQPVLGWARFPWQYASAPALDGVSINVAALPGGRASGYNLGDTIVHEVGHWLGLFHTFEGGCGDPGDLVPDTAAEDEPSYYCQTSRDTCPAPGLDPVRNFMDYSLDACMNMFTTGQVRRMDTAFERWRY